MAGLIGLQAADIDIQDAFQVKRWKYEGEWIPHPVVRLTTTLPIAINEPDGRSIVRARWGFDVGAGRPIGNARDDRLLESRMWSSMLGKSPCLFAATAIYEQVREPKKVSYWFRRRDGKPIVMPGIAGERGVKGEKQTCAAIITTNPNDFFGQYHDRMVCTLAAAELDAWMGEKDSGKAMKLLHPPDNSEWEAVPVEDRIFSAGRREITDLVPIGEPERWK